MASSVRPIGPAQSRDVRLGPQFMRLASGLTVEEFLNIPIIMLFSFNGYLPFISSSGAGKGHASWVRHLSEIAFLAVTGFFFFRNHARIHWELWTTRLAALYIAWALLSTTWSTLPFTGSIAISLVELFTFFYFNYLLDRFTISEFIRICVWAFTILMFASIVFAILLPSHGLDAGLSNPHDKGSWQGVFEQKNMLGLSAAISVALTLGLRPASSIDRIWRWALFLSAMVCALGSKSRESWVAIFFIFLLAMVLRLFERMDQKSRLPLFLIFSFTTALLVVIAYQELDAILALFGRDRTLTGRTEIWSSTILLIRRHPWLGYGSYAVWGTPLATDVVVRTGWNVTSSHNNYLETVLAFGLIGLAIYMPIPISSFLFMFRAVMSYSIVEYRPLIYIIAVLLVMSFAIALITCSPGIGLISLLYCVANLERVERSGIMRL